MKLKQTEPSELALRTTHLHGWSVHLATPTYSLSMNAQKMTLSDSLFLLFPSVMEVRPLHFLPQISPRVRPRVGFVQIELNGQITY